MIERKDYLGCKDYRIPSYIAISLVSFIASKVNALDIELQLFSQLLVRDISDDIYQLSERFYSQYMLTGKL